MRTDWENLKVGDTVSGPCWPFLVVGQINEGNAALAEGRSVQVIKSDGTLGAAKFSVGERGHFTGFETTRNREGELRWKRHLLIPCCNSPSTSFKDSFKKTAGATLPISLDGYSKPAKNTPMPTYRLSSIISGDGTINAVVNGRPYTIGPDAHYYEQAKAALRAKDGAEFIKQCDLETDFRRRSRGQVTYKDGVVYHDGNPIHNSLTERIVALVKQDFDFEPLLKFLKNLLANPEQRAVDELYLFLEFNKLPITEDGCFLAYRRVGEDYMSIHPNPDGSRNRNKIGDVVIKPRNECNPNRDETCSRGLHFCSIEYLPHYAGPRTMIVKINPADVVSIPRDYNNQKGRCCKYEVVDEYVPNDDKDVLAESAVYATTPTGIKPSGQKFHNLRDAKGRFKKK